MFFTFLIKFGRIYSVLFILSDGLLRTLKLATLRVVPDEVKNSGVLFRLLKA